MFHRTTSNEGISSLSTQGLWYKLIDGHYYSSLSQIFSASQICVKTTQNVLSPFTHIAGHLHGAMYIYCNEKPVKKPGGDARFTGASVFICAHALNISSASSSSDMSLVVQPAHWSPNKKFMRPLFIQTAFISDWLQRNVVLYRCSVFYETE